MPKSPPLPAEQERMVQRYKAIEQPVLVWIISIARKCGLNLLGLRIGTAYAEAHEEVSLSTYDLQPLSDLIAKSKTRVEIPEEIARYLDEIIDLRTRVGVWYRSNTAASDSTRIARNKTHRDRTAEWQQARKRVRHLYPPSMLHNPRMSRSADALSSPVDKLAAPKIFPSRSSCSEHETNVEHKSITMTCKAEDILSAENSQENMSLSENVNHTESESLLQEKRLTEEVLERDKKVTRDKRLTKHETSPPEESLDENVARASASEEESQDPGTRCVEVQSTKTSENEKRKCHKREKKKQKERLKKESEKSASEIGRDLVDTETTVRPLPQRIFVNGAWYVLDESTEN